MSAATCFITTLLVVFALIIFTVSLKTGKPVRSLLLSALSGDGSLFAINIVSSLTGVSLSVNTATLLVSAIGGIPGTVFLLLCDVILG